MGCGAGVDKSLGQQYAARLAVSLKDTPGRRHAEGNSLAYEHAVTVQLAPALIPARMKELQAACAARDSACTLLDVSLRAERGIPSGSVRLRVAPAAVDALIDAAAKDGEVVSRSTHAEDLAEPVADTERQLAMLGAHRARLEEFARSKELKVDQLIAVSKELSSVQTEIDGLNTQRANLRRRIDTELLSIELAPPFAAYGAEQTPVRDALRSFGTDFLRAIGQVISFLAMLLPWLVIAVPGLILLRILWRAITRWLVRREARG
ncbi:MAG TPA: DUF4349 domain-containing protein [Steroidobacteraceae bacterium]|nr:DUF4349 domain-containing protein [Steroidobacteraceae bacterium]